MWKLSISSMLVVAGLLLFAPAPAAAQAAIVTRANNCLIADSEGGISIFNCSQGGLQFYRRDGRFMTANGRCMDHNVPQGGDHSRNNRLLLNPCDYRKQSQIWYYITSGANVDVIQSASNGGVCVNIPSGNDRPGTRMIVWKCLDRSPQDNEKYRLGGRMTLHELARIASPDVMNQVSRSGSASLSSGVSLVAAGGGNIVAAGGGNLVAAGGGNIVAAGGGNMVSSGGSNFDPTKFVNYLIGNAAALLRR